MLSSSWLLCGTGLDIRNSLRFQEIRSTYQGRIEERLPLMAFVLPERLKEKRPKVQFVLEENAEILTTPFDVHATMLDAMDLTQYWNPYKINGADLPRSLSVLSPVRWYSV